MEPRASGSYDISCDGKNVELVWKKTGRLRTLLLKAWAATAGLLVVEPPYDCLSINTAARESSIEGAKILLLKRMGRPLLSLTEGCDMSAN